MTAEFNQEIVRAVINLSICFRTDLSPFCFINVPGTCSLRLALNLHAKFLRHTSHVTEL